MTVTRRALLAAAATGVAFGARAQGTYPNRVIRIIVPAGPGGPTDVFARLVAQRMSATLGKDVIIENRAGAGGAIAAKMVSTAPADGYTLFLANTSTNAIIPAFAKIPDYDPEKQFAAIAIMGGISQMYQRWVEGDLDMPLIDIIQNTLGFFEKGLGMHINQ